MILPGLLGWNIQQNDAFFLDFLVATHLATALVLIKFFANDWVLISKGIVRSLAQREIKDTDTYARLGWLLIAGTVPAGLLGILFEEQLRGIFASSRSAAFFLILNGLLLYAAEALRKRATHTKELNGDASLAKLSWTQSLGIGTMQALALIPGFSRSGATMGGGLLVGLSNEDSARFSFLLATPIIFGAALLKLPEFALPQNHDLIGPAIVGAICAGVTAYISVRFLLRYFETQRLSRFALYCLLAGGISFAILSLR